MKALVTGGAGFIGSHVADSLVEQGYDVIVVDDLSTGSRDNVNPKAVLEIVDIASKKLREVFARHKPEIVFHLAARVNVYESLADPMSNAQTNIIGSLNLLECCREFKVKKIIYSSSAGVYGDADWYPVKESAKIQPTNPYGITKAVIEYYLEYYFIVHKLDYTILRYSNVYGPRQDPKGESGVINIFTNCILNKKRPKIFGKGDSTRDYVFVRDVARANLLAAQKSAHDRVFNIGTGMETTPIALANLISGLLSSRIKPEFTPEIQGDIKRSVLDISRGREQLGYGPESDLNSSLRLTVEWIRKQKESITTSK